MNFILNNKMFIGQLIQCFLCSFSQVILQRSVVIGFLSVLGVGLNSPTMLLGAIVAVISALLSAHFFKYDRELIISGFYGYNAVLAGTAVFLFLPLNIFSVILAIMLGALSAVILHVLAQKRMVLPVFTAPFIILTWLLLLLMQFFDVEPVIITTKANAVGDYYVVMRGIGQIIFQNYWLSGAVIIVGLFLYSYKVATWAIVGSLTGVIIARIFDFPVELTHQGLYSFNASLTAIALVQWFKEKPCRAKLFKSKLFNTIFNIKLLNARQNLIFIGIIISIFFTRGFELISIPGITAPFVLASWIIILLAKKGAGIPVQLEETVLNPN